MNSTALDLILRIARTRLAAERCVRCGADLESSRVTIQTQDADQVVLEVVCRECERAALMCIGPDAK